MTEKVMLEQALAAAKAAASQAGEVVLSYYNSHYVVQSKGVDNPVTTADTESNRVLRAILTEALPDVGWLSEESADNAERLKQDAVWIIDPIDGTKEFIQGIDEFVIVVALVVKHRVSVAVTYNPVRREMFSACQGQGAFCNDQPIRVTSTSTLPGAVVLASRSETGRGEWDRFREILTIRPMGSVAYKLAQVAQGRCDATFSLVPKNEWDICAGTLLVAEAGGRVTDLQGAPFRFNQRDPLRQGLIATNGRLHDQVLRLTQPVAV